MNITITSVFVNDQTKACDFYTKTLGFQVKNDIPLGEDRWLTVVSPEQPEGPELLLEPTRHPAAATFAQALKSDGLPVTQFSVADLAAEYDRLSSLGVQFTMEPTDAGPVLIAVLDDTCGNLIQLVQPKA